MGCLFGKGSDATLAVRLACSVSIAPLNQKRVSAPGYDVTTRPPRGFDNHLHLSKIVGLCDICVDAAFLDIVLVHPIARETSAFRPG